MDRGLSAQQSSISPRAPNAIHGWVGMMASAFTYGYAVIYWQLAGHVKFAYRTCIPSRPTSRRRVFAAHETMDV